MGQVECQGMIEHMADSIAVAYGKQQFSPQTPAELLDKAKAFAMSDKEFKPNTKNILMSEVPAALRHGSIEDAIQELHDELSAFFSYYQKQPNGIVSSPFFGDLNYREWLHLLYKHARHHLKQFALVE